MHEYTAATGPAAAADDDGETAKRATAFAELYRTRNRQLVAYATSLVGDALAAEDLVAQAHFRVWRQLRAGREIENVPTHLTTTLRHLAAGLDRAQEDVDAVAADSAAGRGAGAQDPEQYARQVALLARRIKQLPDRWVGALWHADAEDLPMHAIGARIGADESTAAVLVGRAREQLGESFLRAQPGTAPSELCAEHWELMPSIVHGTTTTRKTRQFGRHVRKCKDCGARLALLTQADSQFPLLLGAALLAAVLGGETRLLPAISGTTLADAGLAGARAPRTGARHARVKPAVAARGGRQSSNKPKLLLSSVGIVGVAAAATALALGAAGTHHTAAAAAITAPSDAATQPAAPGAAVGTSLPGQVAAATTPTGHGSTPLGTLLSQPAQTAAQATQTTQAATGSASSTPSGTGTSTGSTGSQSATAPAGSTTSSAPPSTSSSPTTTPSSPSGGASGSGSAAPPTAPPTTPPPSTPSAPPTTSTPSTSPSTSDTSSDTPAPSVSPSADSSSAAAQTSETATEAATP